MNKSLVLALLVGAAAIAACSKKAPEAPAVVAEPPKVEAPASAPAPAASEPAAPSTSVTVTPPAKEPAKK